MCGRYSLFTDSATLSERFQADFSGHEPRYNCAPGQDLPVVLAADPELATDGGRPSGAANRVVSEMHWGFTPEWAAESFDLINARAETLTDKRSFRAAVERRRCLVPADGFYEWADRGDGKRPYRVAFEDDRPFAMAGIWERWTPQTAQTGLSDFGSETDPDQDDAAVETFAVVTTDPNDLVADLHHRMAVVLDESEEATWLSGSLDQAASLLDPYPDTDLEAYPVSTRVNSPANDDPDLVEPVDT